MTAGGLRWRSQRRSQTIRRVTAPMWRDCGRRSMTLQGTVTLGQRQMVVKSRRPDQRGCNPRPARTVVAAKGWLGEQGPRCCSAHHHRLDRPRGSPSLGKGAGDRRVSARAHQGRCRRAVPGRRQLSLLPPTGAGPTGRAGAERGPPPGLTSGYRPRAAGGHRLATSSRTPAWPRWSSGLQQVPSWPRRIRRAPAE
jgi:hypothetical protein